MTHLTTLSAKYMFLTGGIASVLAWCFGDYNKNGVTLLCILMLCDLITALIVCTVFKNSPKATHGTLSSRLFAQGIFKKISMLLCVMITHRCEIFLNVPCLTIGVSCAFSGNELLSITENIGLMGVKYPDKLKDIIDILKNKGDKNDKNS